MLTVSCQILPLCSTRSNMAQLSSWKSGKKGSLSPWQQAVAVALLKMSDKMDVPMTYSDIAGKVTKVGGGHLSKQAISDLAAAVAADAVWYPGKVTEHAAKRGPKPLFSAAKKLQVAKSAMALKRRGLEPTVAAVQLQTPAAATNKKTGGFFTAPTISKVFKEHCFDADPADPWCLTKPYQKTALPPAVQSARVHWANAVKEMGRGPGWYFKNCVWFDPCNTVIPAAKRTVFDYNQGIKGKRRRWMSNGSKMQSRNLMATPYACKQRQWADKRAWWFVVLFRGKVVLELMPIDWVQTGHGMAEFVHRLPGILRKRLVAQSMPKVVVTDRGPGFFQASSGTIVAAYKEALDTCGFRPFAGEEAKWQPPDIPDVLLHETVVSWVPRYFKQLPFKWTPKVDDNLKLFVRRLKECERHINANYDVDGLCRKSPSRLNEQIVANGDRLKH